MPCIKTLQSVVVQSADSLTLNCTCFDKTNGIWIGPNKLLAEQNIPYATGTVLNPNLNKSKYIVFGGSDVAKCNLGITNFMPDDDGTYTCHYIISNTFHIDVHTVVATGKLN